MSFQSHNYVANCSRKIISSHECLSVYGKPSTSFFLDENVDLFDNMIADKEFEVVQI